MNNRRKLLLSALSERFRQLCDLRIRALSPEDFGDRSSFVLHVQEQFSDASIETLRKQKRQPATEWHHCEPNGASALRSLALGKPLATTTSRAPAVAEFLQDLKSARKDLSQSCELLMKRYACPLNFTGATEDSVREFVLERLMVRERRTIEQDLLATVDNDYFWHRLNLIAIHAQASGDLRFLDALNYYFELIPDHWHSRAKNNWLMVSYLALYAHALASQYEGI